MGRSGGIHGAIAGAATGLGLGASYLGWAQIGPMPLPVLAAAAGVIVGGAGGHLSENYMAAPGSSNRLKNFGRYIIGGVLPAASLILAGMSGALFPKKVDKDLEDVVLHAEQPVNVTVSNETAHALQTLGVNVSAGQYQVNVSGNGSFVFGGQFVPAERAHQVLGKLFHRDPAHVLVAPGASGHVELEGAMAGVAGNAAGLGNVSALSVLEHVADGKASGAYAADGKAGALNNSQVRAINDVFDNGKLDGSIAKVGKLRIGTPQDFADYVTTMAVAQSAPYHLTLEEVFGHTPSDVMQMAGQRIMGNDSFQQGGWSAVELMKASLAAKGASVADLAANISAIRNDANLSEVQKQRAAVDYLVQADFQLGKNSVAPSDSLAGFKDALWDVRNSYLRALGVGSRAALERASTSELVNLSYETGIMQQWESERGNVSTYKLQELQSLGRANGLVVEGKTAAELEALLPADALADYLESHGVAVSEIQKTDRPYLNGQVDSLISAQYLQGFRDFASRLGLNSPASLDDLVAEVWEWNNASDRVAYNQGFADAVQARNEILYLNERSAAYFAGLGDNAQASRELAAWEQAQRSIDSLVQAHLLPNYESNPWQSASLNGSTNTSALRDIANEKYSANSTLRNATVDYIIDFANAETGWTVKVYNTTGNTSYLVRGWVVDGQFVRADKGVVIGDREFSALSNILARYE